MKSFEWIKVVAGFWVLISPWVLNFSGINLALWSNIIAGIIIIVFSLWSICGKKESNR